MSGADGARTALFCYGNPARGDDGLGPELAEREELKGIEGLRVECDYQLLVEDAVTVAQSDLVVFADASIEGEGPYAFARVAPRPATIDSHSVEPGALLGLSAELFGRCPEAYTLAIRGYSFEMFREGLTEGARENLEKAAGFLASFLRSRAGSAGGLTPARRTT